MSQPAVLEAVDLVFGREGRALGRLDSIRLSSGQALLLLGPSGSGKTTLLFTLAGLLAPIEGRVEIDGRPFSAAPPPEQRRLRGRRIGLVFQDMHLAPGLSVLDNLLLAPFAVGERQDRTRARELLKALGLEGLEARPGERLSRGQAQRAAIARAMLLRPAVILADEPTASLDDENAAVVMDLLSQAAAETGAALVVATHDARVRSRIADHVTLGRPPEEKGR